MTINMVVAVKTDSYVLPSVTQESLYDGVKSAFANAGFDSVFDEYVRGTDKIVVYKFDQDASKIYGSTYLRIRITVSLVIGQQIYALWASANHTGTNGSTEIVYPALPANAGVNFVALDGGNEYRLVHLTQGVTTIALGLFSPVNRPDWWDLNAWNYSFTPSVSSFASFRSSTLNPYSNAEHDCSLNAVRMATANIRTNRRDLLPGIIFYTQSNQGISGKTSDDLVMVAANGTSRYDTIQVPNDAKQYLILNPASGGLAVRII